MSATWGNSEKIYSLGVLPPVTQIGLLHLSERPDDRRLIADDIADGAGSTTRRLSTSGAGAVRPGLCPRLLRKTGRLLVAQDVCASAAFPPRLGAAVKTSPKYRGAVRMPVLYAPRR